MTTPTPTGTTHGAPTPDTDTDNWQSTSLDAPRQKAGEAIEQESDRADTAGIDPDKAADAEVAAERQATGRGPSAGA